MHAASVDDVDSAVRAAKSALKTTWNSVSAQERGWLLSRLADLIEERKEVFATIDAWNNGKTYVSAMSDDVEDIVSTLRYYSGWADKKFGQTIHATKTKFGFTIRQPVGVVGQIIPWNYPLGEYYPSQTLVTAP